MKVIVPSSGKSSLNGSSCLCVSGKNLCGSHASQSLKAGILEKVQIVGSIQRHNPGVFDGREILGSTLPVWLCAKYIMTNQ